MPTHRTTVLRDPATWGVERDDHPAGRFFLLRNEVNGKEHTVMQGGPAGWMVWNAVGSRSYRVTRGNRPDLHGSCTCQVWPNVEDYCEHTACVEAVRRFLAREAEKESTRAEERRERCRAEVENLFS